MSVLTRAGLDQGGLRSPRLLFDLRCGPIRISCNAEEISFREKTRSKQHCFTEYSGLASRFSLHQT